MKKGYQKRIRLWKSTYIVPQMALYARALILRELKQPKYT